MRASSPFTPSVSPSSAHAAPACGASHPRVPAPDAPRPASGLPTFLPFSAQALNQARARHIPVFLLIGDIADAFGDPSLSMQLSERTVPVQLTIGARPDVELLCQRAGMLFSGEGALPLCALLLHDARPFLAAPLPPVGFPMEASRLYMWLSQADRRFAQNLPALTGQAAQVLGTFRVPHLRKPYAPQDAAHDLVRTLLTIEDAQSGGFGHVKAPFVCALRFLQHEAARGEQRAHRAVTRALDAMLSSALYDPLDGAFFRATLTDDWRAFIPEKPLAINAMLALILLEGGRRSEAVRTLDFLISAFALSGGGLSPQLSAPRTTYAFTPEQACAVLGSEDGLRARRLLSLLRRHAREEPALTPSRFSPVSPDAHARRRDMEPPALYPTLSAALTPEDAAFLRRALPILLRARAARTPQVPAPYMLTQDAALAAAVLAHCGRRLGESRYTQAAQRAVTALISQPPAWTPTVAGGIGLPASLSPVSPLHAQATCGAAAALALALLTLGQGEDMGAYAQSGLRLLGTALHAFVRPDGLVMHTPQDTAACFPRIPALDDGELPSPAALLAHALRLADRLRPDAHYAQALRALWDAAAPSAHARPLSCAALIDAVLS